MQFGEKVIVRDSMNLFCNLNNDTIQSRPAPGCWKAGSFYEPADSIKIVATITGFDTYTFLGLTDSVKTIGLMVE